MSETLLALVTNTQKYYLTEDEADYLIRNPEEIDNLPGELGKSRDSVMGELIKLMLQKGDNARSIK